MAKAVVGAAGIETISGALKKPKKQNGHNHGNYLVMTHRTAETTNPNCQRIYAFGPERYERSSAPTENEIAQRLKFGTIAKAVNARAKDLTKITADQEAYAAQTKYKTMRSFLWSLEKAEYEKNH